LSITEITEHTTLFFYHNKVNDYRYNSLCLGNPVMIEIILRSDISNFARYITSVNYSNKIKLQLKITKLGFRIKGIKGLKPRNSRPLTYQTDKYPSGARLVANVTIFISRCAIHSLVRLFTGSSQ
jgi:hypothetical protein